MGEGEVLYHAKVVASGPPQRDGSWRNVSQKFNHPQAKLAQADPEIDGLRFTFPSNTGSGADGNFKTNFSPDYAFLVGPDPAAQEVSLQFKLRSSCPFRSTDSAPNPPNYRNDAPRCNDYRERVG